MVAPSYRMSCHFIKFNISYLRFVPRFPLSVCFGSPLSHCHHAMPVRLTQIVLEVKKKKMMNVSPTTITLSCFSYSMMWSFSFVTKIHFRILLSSPLFLRSLELSCTFHRPLNILQSSLGRNTFSVHLFASLLRKLWIIYKRFQFLISSAPLQLLHISSSCLRLSVRPSIHSN